MNSAKLQEDIQLFQEAHSVWSPYIQEMEEDFRFYLGDQWEAHDRAEAKRRKIPDLDLNIIKKSVDVLSGYQRQNRADLKAMPIEGGDEMLAEVYSRVLHWIMVQSVNEYAESQAFKDAILGGIGWIEPYMNYSQDMLHGDILVRKESPFSVMVDPSATEIDLSDAEYLIRQKRVPKTKLQQMYPDKAEEFKYLEGTDNYLIGKHTRIANSRNHLRVTEFWRRTYEDRQVIVNTEDPADYAVWEGPDESLKIIMQQNPEYRVVRKRMPVIRLRTNVEDHVILYDDENPSKLKNFPLIPVFAFFDSSYDDWKLKLSGMVRSLKDPQREKNKRRSAIMAIINTIAHSGYIIDKGAVDDINVLRQSAGTAKIIEKNPNKHLERISPPDMPGAMMQLEQMFDNDIRYIGANPDLLGMREAKDPGIAIQLRQKQGITTLQELFDNYSFAKKELGRRILDLVNENWGQEKIERILGSDLPWDAKRKKVEETIQEIQKHALPIEQERERVMVRLDDMQYYEPETIEDELNYRQYGNQIQQQAVQIREQLEQVQMQMEQQQMELDIINQEEEEFWSGFDKARKSTRMDISIDETVSNPTFRFAMQQMLMQWQQYGMPVHPELMLEMSEIPKTIKDKMKPAFVEHALQGQQQRAPSKPKQQGGE